MKRVFALVSGILLAVTAILPSSTLASADKAKLPPVPPGVHVAKAIPPFVPPAGYERVAPESIPGLTERWDKFLQQNPGTKLERLEVYRAVSPSGNEPDSTSSANREASGVTATGGVLPSASCSIGSVYTYQNYSISNVNPTGHVTQYVEGTEAAYQKSGTMYWVPTRQSMRWTRTSTLVDVISAHMTTYEWGNDICTNASQQNSVTTSNVSVDWLDGTNSYTYYIDTVFSNWNPNQVNVAAYHRTTSDILYDDHTETTGWNTDYVYQAFP